MTRMEHSSHRSRRHRARRVLGLKTRTRGTTAPFPKGGIRLILGRSIASYGTTRMTSTGGDATQGVRGATGVFLLTEGRASEAGREVISFMGVQHQDLLAALMSH